MASRTNRQLAFELAIAGAAAESTAAALERSRRNGARREAPFDHQATGVAGTDNGRRFVDFPLSEPA